MQKHISAKHVAIHDFDQGEIQEKKFLLQYKDPSPQIDKKIRLELSDEMVGNILNNRDRYSEFLRKTSTQAVGRFDPWQVVEQ